MNSNRKSKHPQSENEKNMEQTPEAEASGEPKVGIVAETAVDAEELRKQIADLQARVDEYKDGWQRSVADFQNYRRRVEAEKAEAYQTAVGSVIKRYLPVLDDMERALAAAPKDQPWVEGLELISHKLQGILEAEGLKRMDVIGQQFDPHFHEAISQEPSEEYESGQVIAVIQNGYMLGERVIRPALVRVAR